MASIFQDLKEIAYTDDERPSEKFLLDDDAQQFSLISSNSSLVIS